MQKLNIIALKRLNQHKLGQSSQAAWVVKLAHDYLEQRFKGAAGDIEVTKLENAILYVRVNASAWAQELWLIQQDLIDFIHAECGSGVVLKLRITSV